MSSFLCFICHNTVHDDTNGETREKYRELIGMKLCPDSHVCHICCHMLSKLWLFKSICLRRSMEYPILFSDKGTISLQTSNTELIIMCPATDECDPHHATQRDPDHNTSSNHYVSLEERTNINKHELTDDAQKTNEIEYDYTDNLFNDDDYESNENVQPEVENNGSPIRDETFNEELINLDNNDKSDINKELTNLDKGDNTEMNEESSNLDKKIEFHKVVLSIEEQRAELEAKRREDGYLEAEFKCYNCALGFLFKDTYQAHMMRHEESNGEHLCDICTLRFASAAVLRAHQCSHRERVTCLRCGRPVPPRRTAAHRARCGSNSTRAPCHLCGKTFARLINGPTATVTGAAGDVVEAAPGSQSPAQGTPCSLLDLSESGEECALGIGMLAIGEGDDREGWGFAPITELPSPGCNILQANLHHSETATAPEVDGYQHGRGPDPGAVDQERRHMRVPEHQSDANGLQQHIKRFHLAKTSSKSYSCSVCGKRCSTQAAVRTHMIKHINKKFPCPLCPASLGSPYALAQHRRAHAAADLRCEACGRGYRSRKSLLAHLRNSLAHQQTVFACPICARPCPHRSALASHMQTVHAAVKQHACSLCPARYTSRKSLAAHARGHEGRGAARAVCHLCGASFKGNSKLNRHLRSVCEKGKLEEELAAFYNQE